MSQFIDEFLIKFLNKIWGLFSWVYIFIIFFNFDFLKVLNLSPFIEFFFNKNLFFISFYFSSKFLDYFERFISILFIIPKIENMFIFLLILWMIIIALSISFLLQVIPEKFLVLTIKKQCITKNFPIIFLVLLIGSNLKN